MVNKSMAIQGTPQKTGATDSDLEVIKLVNMCHFLMIAVVYDSSKEKLENILQQAIKNGLLLSISNIFHLVVWSQFAFGSLSPPPQNLTFLVGSFGYFHLVVW